MKLSTILNENTVPKIIKNLELCFGSALWDASKPFNVTDNDLHLMFDVINDGLFENKLNRGISKFTLKAETIPTGPQKYRDLENALAAFTIGQVKGVPNELIIVKHSFKCNFYIILCALIHEMIHMYDFHYGPMSKQLDKYGAAVVYNFNYPFIDPRTNKKIEPSVQANIFNAQAAGFQHSEQLPNELLSQINDPSKNNMHPRQFQVPGQQIKPFKDPNTGELIPRAEPLSKKFKMDDLDGFYDVHGDFFKNIASTINSYGFSITDIFDQNTPIKMTKTYESENTIPSNPAETLMKFFKTDEHIGCDFQDENNWFVEIT